MKTIKLLFFLLAFSAVLFYSCSDEHPIKNNAVATQKSIALRTSLNEIKKANSISGRASKTMDATTNPFCFNFVYPISLSFNNGTVITVSSFEGLIDVLSNEAPNFYLEGIFFPFQVTHTGSVHTISSESDFVALLEMCGFDTINDDLYNTFCFDFVFPMSITQGDNTILVFGNADELTSYLNNPNNGSESNIIFPISVLYQGEVVIIHSLYEFYEITNNCDDCICTQEYAPVCVHTPNGIVEYGNFCHAQCAGYTQNDLVSCNPQTVCSISNVVASPGACVGIGINQYSLTINFSYTSPVGDTFTVRNNNNDLIGTYSLSALPVTIPNYPTNNTSSDSLHIQIGANCSALAQWAPPMCGCVCPTDFDPVCVQGPNGIVQYSNSCVALCHGYTANDYITCGVAPHNFSTQLGSCFQMSYPVNVQFQGALVQVNSDGELLQYYFPATGSIPSLRYPITVTFANTIHTFANQAAFNAVIAASCP